MNRFLPFLVTAMLALSSLWAGVESYSRAEARIAEDLTHALAQTAMERPADWLSTDTIRVFRSHLQTEQLRDRAYLAFSILDERRQPLAGAIATDTLVVAEAVRAQGYATCSPLTVLRMSDQRLAAVLLLLTLMSLFYSLRRVRPIVAVCVSMTPPSSSSDDSFIGLLTPMQARLVQLFMESPTRELTKQQICDALWPRKDNAAETLYTLIHRIKPILDAHTDLRIISNRGRSYRLEHKEIMN